MTVSRIAALYSIFSGVCIAAVWIVLLITGSVPETETQPVSISYHLASEILTAATLAAAGLLLLKESPRAYTVFFISAGLFIYSLLNVTGFYAQQGYLLPAMGFTVMTILEAILVAAMLRPSPKGKKR